MKNALIIGATSGIGLELSKLLVAENYKVVITGRRKELLHQIQETNPDQYIVKVQDVTNIDLDWFLEFDGATLFVFQF